MSSVFSLVGFCIVSCGIILIVDQYIPQYKPLVMTAAAIAVSLSLSGNLQQIFKLFEHFTNDTNYLSSGFMILLRCMGISVLSQIAGDICRDCDQKTLSQMVEMGGKTFILLMVLPVINEVLEMILGIASVS